MKADVLSTFATFELVDELLLRLQKTNGLEFCDKEKIVELCILLIRG